MRRRGAARSDDVGFQVIEGFGASVRAFSHSDLWRDDTNPPVPGTSYPLLTTGQRDAIHDALYSPTTGIGLTRARSVEVTTKRPDSSVQTIEPSNDDADPLVYNAAGFTFTVPVDAVATQFGEGKARYPQLVTWWSPLFSPNWITGKTSSTPNATQVAEYAEWMLAVIRRFNTQGQPLSYVSVANEPGYSRNTLSAQFQRDVIKNLGPRLASEGLAVPFVVSDDIRASVAAATIDVIMADATAAQYVAKFATHPYDEAESNMALMTARAVTHKLPLWQTELTGTGLGSMPGSTTGTIGFALAIHNMLALYNCTAFDSLFGAFGYLDAGAGDVLVELNYSGATYSGFTINKYAHYLGQYARYVRPGMRRVPIATSDSGAKVTAFRNGAARTIVAVNPTGSPITTTLTSEVFGKVSSLAVVRSSASETWAAQTAVSCSGVNTVSVTLPANSVTSFTATAAA